MYDHGRTHLQFCPKRLHEHWEPSQQKSFPLVTLGHPLSRGRQNRPRLHEAKFHYNAPVEAAPDFVHKDS